MHESDPMAADNRGLGALREKKKGNVAGKTTESETRRHERSALRPATGVGERGIQLAQRFTPHKITVSLYRRRSSATVLQFDMDGNQKIPQHHVHVEKISI